MNIGYAAPHSPDKFEGDGSIVAGYPMGYSLLQCPPGAVWALGKEAQVAFSMSQFPVNSLDSCAALTAEHFERENPITWSLPTMN